MVTSKEDLQRLFRMLGLAITLPMVLVSGPLAGYLISQWMIQKWHLSSNLTLICTLVGLVGSIIQAVRLLNLLSKESRNTVL